MKLSCNKQRQQNFLPDLIQYVAFYYFQNGISNLVELRENADIKFLRNLAAAP